jgi:hypothetical protein
MLESKAQEMEQDHEERAQDSADAADQYDQPAVTDVQAGNKIGKKENKQPHNCIYDEIFDGSQDQKCSEDYDQY